MAAIYTMQSIYSTLIRHMQHVSVIMTVTIINKQFLVRLGRQQFPQTCVNSRRKNNNKHLVQVNKNVRHIAKQLVYKKTTA